MADGIGTFDIRTHPTGARIYIDVIFTGKTTNAVFDWVVGTHTVKLVKEGYEDLTVTSTLREGFTSVIDKVLTSEEVPPEKGTLHVSSTPSRAKIYLNGEYTDELTSETFELDPGTYTVKLTKTDYKDWSTLKTIHAAASHEIDATLEEEEEPPPEKGIIVLTSAPTGARVYLNDVDTGFLTNHDFERDPGHYAIKLTKEGYEDKTVSITLVANVSHGVHVVLKEEEEELPGFWERLKDIWGEAVGFLGWAFGAPIIETLNVISRILTGRDLDETRAAEWANWVPGLNALYKLVEGKDLTGKADDTLTTEDYTELALFMIPLPIGQIAKIGAKTVAKRGAIGTVGTLEKIILNEGKIVTRGATKITLSKTVWQKALGAFKWMFGVGRGKKVPGVFIITEIPQIIVMWGFLIYACFKIFGEDPASVGYKLNNPKTVWQGHVYRYIDARKRKDVDGMKAALGDLKNARDLHKSVVAENETPLSINKLLDGANALSEYMDLAIEDYQKEIDEMLPETKWCERESQNIPLDEWTEERCGPEEIPEEEIIIELEPKEPTYNAWKFTIKAVNATTGATIHANIWLDGVFLDKRTPWFLFLAPESNYTLKLTLFGYEDAVVQFDTEALP